MRQEVITKKENLEYNGYSGDKEYIYLTTICPLCGETRLEHFIPLDEEITVNEILEEACLECREIMGILETYDVAIDEV